GFAERADYVPKRDATVVARMRAAGAIVLGKTNVNDGKPLYERPRNPHDLERTPGASSSGEAAIIAAGGSPLGLGSDSGGSLRRRSPTRHERQHARSKVRTRSSKRRCRRGSMRRSRSQRSTGDVRAWAWIGSWRPRRQAS